MKLLELQLENFRSIKELTIRFDGKNTDIYGANGTGKTTIANAICWLLLDRAATDEKDFDPKTTGAHDVHHTGKLIIDNDGEIVTLGKDYYEVWTKKKGSPTAEFSGHTTDYSINGVPAKKKEYTALVEAICGVELEKVKMLMIHGYFTEDLPTETRRRILFDVCGDVAEEEIMKRSELEDLNEYLMIPGTKGQQYSTEEYKKIAVEQRRKINKDLEILPARIDEVTRGIPENVPDAQGLKKEIKALEEKKAELEREKQDLQSDGGNEALIRQKIAECKTDYATRQAEYIQAGQAANEEINQKIESVQQEHLTISRRLQEAEQDVRKFEYEISRMKEQRERLLQEYAEVQSMQWDPHQETCPTCKQPLPATQIDAMRKEFNLNQSMRKEEINKRGQDCSQDRIAELEREKNQVMDTVSMLKEQEKLLVEQLQELKGQRVIRPAFDDTSEAKEIQQTITRFQRQLQAGTNATNDAVRLQDIQIEEVTQQIQEANARFSVIEAKKEGKKRIKELQDEQKEKAAMLEHLEYGIHLCEEYTRIKARMITDKINSRFRTVHFQLFEDQVNGGLKEICDPTVQNATGEWVRYKSVNTANKVNAELEIIDVLNEFYGTDLPVIMDRAESVSRPIAIKEQLIRLIVSEKDIQIRVEN